MVRILVVEDETKLADALARGLRREGYDVEWAATGEAGAARIAGGSFAAVILDWMLPGREGVEVLKALRGQGDATPVLLLTARDAVEDRVAGLDAGADDYLVKPFAFAELSARLRALLRRGAAEPTLFREGDLELDALTRRVVRGPRVLDLTLREFDLLHYLLRHRGGVVSRAMLARDVWRETARATPLDNVIDVHVARLRRKLDPEPFPPLLHTVRGVGFVLSERAP